MNAGTPKTRLAAYREDPAKNGLIKDIIEELIKRGYEYLYTDHDYTGIHFDLLIDGELALVKDCSLETRDIIEGLGYASICIGEFLDHPERYLDMPDDEKRNVVITACDKIEEKLKEG